MSSSQDIGLTPTGTIATHRDRRRVLFATLVGTTVEWYDFFIYATTLALVFNAHYFSVLGPNSAVVGFATIGVSFLFRPLGAFLAGHFGDKYGRKTVLMWTLILMGIATALVGVVPTPETIGLGAPLMLALLRILQGLSAGGEWGGAVLMAVEHAPKQRRGIFGAAPQIGVPLGLLMASAVMAIMNIIAPGDAFIEWGWRIPFIFSLALILVGYYVRRRVEESPVFAEIAERKEHSTMPMVQLFRKHALLVIVAALVFAGNNAVGYMTTGGYLQGYSVGPDSVLKLERGPVLLAVSGSAVVWLCSTLFAGWLCDRIGRRTTYLIGWGLQLGGVLALFPLVNTANPWLIFAGAGILAIGLGFTYGPQAALYSELFPASVRFSGVSVAYAIGAIAGGAFAPTIAKALYDATGGTTATTVYLSCMTLVGLLATLLLKDRPGIPLGPDHEQEQAKTPIYGFNKG